MSNGVTSESQMIEYHGFMGQDFNDNTYYWVFKRHPWTRPAWTNMALSSCSQWCAAKVLSATTYISICKVNNAQKAYKRST